MKIRAIWDSKKPGGFTANIASSLKATVELMTRRGIAAPVVTEERVAVGLISERHIVEAFAREPCYASALGDRIFQGLSKRIGLNVSLKSISLSSVLMFSMCGAAAQATSAGEAGGTIGANANANNGTAAGIGAATTGAPSAKISQSGMVTDNAAVPYQTAIELPFASNEGTLAESAKTTALSTSTYNQSTGILPGWKWTPF